MKEWIPYLSPQRRRLSYAHNQMNNSISCFTLIESRAAWRTRSVKMLVQFIGTGTRRRFCWFISCSTFRGFCIFRRCLKRLWSCSRPASLKLIHFWQFVATEHFLEVDRIATLCKSRFSFWISTSGVVIWFDSIVCCKMEWSWLCRLQWFGLLNFCVAWIHGSGRHFCVRGQGWIDTRSWYSCCYSSTLC